MESPAQTPTLWQRSTTRRFLRWFFNWRAIRRLFFAAVVLTTLIAFLYAEENWRGKRA